MKHLLKPAFAAAVLLGSTVAPVQPASAGVGVSIGIGVPGPVYGYPYGPGYVAYDDDYYYDPIYISGAWYHGPYRWRMIRGERVFYVNGGWHRNEWRGGPMPGTIVFRNGGEFRDGRNIGFGDAERINARFRPAGVRGDQREIRSDRQNIRQDRRQLNDDRQEKREDRHDDQGNR